MLKKFYPMSDGKNPVREIFKRLNQKQMKKLLYFSASWCGPCRTFGPIMDKISQSGIPIQKVDVETDLELVQSFSILNVPTVILVQNGQEVKRFSGVKTEQQVKDFYNN